MKLLLDMNISPRWVHFLQENGIKAIHWMDCGVPDSPDKVIMKYAREHDYIVFTHDLDSQTFHPVSYNKLRSKFYIISLPLCDYKIYWEDKM